MHLTPFDACRAHVRGVWRDATHQPGRLHRHYVLRMRRTWKWLARPIEGVAPAGQGRDGSELASRLSCAGRAR